MEIYGKRYCDETALKLYFIQITYLLLNKSFLNYSLC